MTVPAGAHAMPMRADPDFGSTLSSPYPKQVKIRFTEPIELAGTKLQLTGEAGTPIALGSFFLDPADQRTLTIALPGVLPEGDLTIEWETVSVRAHHRSNGKFHFDVAN
jgi:methionine-rich copper-binding protein CopC